MAGLLEVLSRSTRRRYWETFILSLVLANSVVLALYDYTDRDFNTKWSIVLHYLDLGFTVMYVLEAIIRIVAVGFVSHRESYLRSGWHFIDLFIIIVGYLPVAILGFSTPSRPFATTAR